MASSRLVLGWLIDYTHFSTNFSTHHTFWYSKDTLTEHTGAHTVIKWSCRNTPICKLLLILLSSQFTIRSRVPRFHAMNLSHKDSLGSAFRHALVFLSFQYTAFIRFSTIGSGLNSTNWLRCNHILCLVCDDFGKASTFIRQALLVLWP